MSEGTTVDLLILRLIHIGVGAFWVGAVFTNVLFLQPAAAALGPDGGRFMFRLIRHGRFPMAILGSAILTVVSGIVLLWMTTDGLDIARLLAANRLGFTVGGIAAILTFAVGSLYVFPRTERLAELMGAVMTEQRPPSGDEQATLMRLRTELLRAGWVTVVGLAIAVVAMATGRYWGVVLG